MMTDNDQDRHDSDYDDDSKTITGGKMSPGGNLGPGHPREIGQYKIKRIIDSGGMGTVYEAVQNNPRRPVAIKVVKGSAVSVEAIGRLKHEAQLLARLRHPGIAQIYEAGTYEFSGEEAPFFAMEYIPNAKLITRYASEKNLTISEKLRLFAQVCDAVHHGHQRGIVHRDLKPANILVDSTGNIKIIDFGVARATDADLKRTTIQTSVGQLVGTVSYMSPEQLEADPNDIDTRSDVYSLGVVLFELISGELPYELKSKTLFELSRTIREERPNSLSQKVPGLPEEIEIIAGKALQKDRELRYQSAHGLASDIRRYLNGEAITARSPSWNYQAKIFARKNKLLVGMLGAIFLLLLLSTVVTYSLLLKVEDERTRVAEESARSTAAKEFLLDVISSAAPHGYGDQVTVLDFLKRADQKLKDAFLGDPEAESDVRYSIGDGFGSLGHYDEALEQAKLCYELRNQTLGPAHQKTQSALSDLGGYYLITNQASEYLDVWQEIYRVDSATYGENAEVTLSDGQYVVIATEYALTNDKALTLCDTLMKKSRAFFGEDHPLTCSYELQYAWLLMQAGEFEEAESLAKTVNARMNSLPATESWLVDEGKSTLAAIYISQGKINESMAVYGNTAVPEDLGLTKNFQGDFLPGDKKAHVVIFWEEWCPYSMRKVPVLEKYYRQYAPLGVDIVGVTRVTKSATDENVLDFLKKNQISYPIVKENGRAWNYFGCTGTPSIFIVSDGMIVWRNRVSSDAALSWRMLEGLVKGHQSTKTDRG